MPRIDRHLLAGTALTAVLALAAPGSPLAQQGSNPAPPSAINQPAMNQGQSGIPSGSGSHGSAQDAGSAGTPGSTSDAAARKEPIQHPQAMKSPAGNEALATAGEALVGRDLYGADDEKIGAVDKVVMGPNNRASSVLVDIGGFLGMGAKTVAIPVSQLQAEGD